MHHLHTVVFHYQVVYWKTYARTTNKAFNLSCKLVCAGLPHVNFPKSYNDAKSVLSEVGLGYETIHVCKFDYALFWGENANKTYCPVCGYSR